MEDVRRFTGEGEFGIDKAVSSCLKPGYKPFPMPEIAERRIKAPEDDVIWQYPYTSLSLRASGKQKSTSVSRKGGTDVVVFSHDYLTNQPDVRQALAGYGNLGMYGYGNMSSREFQKLLNLENDESTFVLARDDWKKWPNGVYGIDEPTEEHKYDFGGKIDGKDMIAINHPQTKAFLTPKRAEPYLQKHKQVFGQFGNRIGIGNYDDQSVMPACRLLMIGNIVSMGHLGFTGNQFVENPLNIYTFAGAKR